MIQEELLLIYSTLDYDIFNFFKSNREADHISIIKKSIQKKDLTKYVPILVDKKMTIIDGQNRYYACKELGLKIHFIIVEEGQESDMILINSCSKKWTTEDYLQHFTQRGDENYILFSKLKELSGLSISSLIHICAIGTTVYQSFREGVLNLKPTAEKELEKTVKIWDALKLFNHDITEKIGIAGIYNFIKYDINIEKMVKKIKTHNQLVEKKASIPQMIRMLKKIYDYREHEKNHLFNKDEKEN